MDGVDIDESLLRSLLREQHPDLAELALREVAGGWDNQMWRLGEDLAVRMPRTSRAPDLLRAEQRWLPFVAADLPLPIPVPLRVGEPSALFPWTWTVVRWVGGEPADRTPVTSAKAADVLADFLRALHRQAPDDAPVNASRGVNLAILQDEIDEWFPVLAEGAVAGDVRQIWDQAAAAPSWHRAPVWVHGDLHPANIVVRDGTVSGVLDFGELCAGDPATDLSVAWVLLPAGSAARFFDAYGDADDATILRARGWAVLRSLHLIGIGRRGDQGLPGGKVTWGPAGRASLERVLAQET